MRRFLRFFLPGLFYGGFHLRIIGLGLFQKQLARAGGQQLGVLTCKGDGTVQLLLSRLVLCVQRQRHKQRLALELAGKIHLRRNASHHSDACHQLGYPQPDGGHQHQAVSAQTLDPETACAVPHQIPQGDIAVELAFFDVAEQQEKAHKAPDALVQKGGMHRQVGVDDHTLGHRDRAAHQVSAGGLAVHSPRQGGVAAKGLLIEKVAPAAAALPDEKAHGGQVEHGQHRHAPPFAGQAAEHKGADDAAVDGQTAVADGQHIPDGIVIIGCHRHIIQAGAGDAQHHADEDDIHHRIGVDAELRAAAERKDQCEAEAEGDVTVF